MKQKKIFLSIAMALIGMQQANAQDIVPFPKNPNAPFDATGGAINYSSNSSLSDAKANINAVNAAIEQERAMARQYSGEMAHNNVNADGSVPGTQVFPSVGATAEQNIQQANNVNAQVAQTSAQPVVQYQQGGEVAFNGTGDNYTSQPQYVEQNQYVQYQPSQTSQAQYTPSSQPSGTAVYGYSGGNDESYNNALKTVSLLNVPDERIRKINKAMRDKNRVLAEPPVNVKLVNTLLSADVSAGATSPVVRLAKNRTTAIILTDSTGAPWPIVNFDGLNNEDFVVKRLDKPSPDGYVISVTPTNDYVAGNLALILKGLNSPLSIEFVSGQKVADAKVEIRVKALGPNTHLATTNMAPGIDTDLLQVLQGVTPEGAKQLTTNSNTVQAWKAKDGKMYLRTRFKVMSPAFENVSSSPDGTYAYKMVPANVVLYKVDNGRFGQFVISGF